MRVSFVAIGSSERSRTGVYRGRLSSQIEQFSLDVSDLVRRPSRGGLRDLGRLLRSSDVVVVATGSQLAVPLVRLTSRAPIVLDAGWPLLDGLMSRNVRGTLGIQVGKTYAIDLTAASLSQVILLESEHQQSHFARRFRGTRAKLRVMPTGTDELALGAPVNPQALGTSATLRVLWRGSYNPESGLDTLWKTIPLLSPEHFTFTVWCHNLPAHLLENVPQGVELDLGFHTLREIGEVMRRNDIVLGQLSRHQRLNRTIPHKAFEAAYLGLPYMSTRATGIEEMLGDSNGAIWVEGDCPNSIVEGLRMAFQCRGSLAAWGADNHARYLRFAGQDKVSKMLEQLLREVAV